MKMLPATDSTVIIVQVIETLLLESVAVVVDGVGSPGTVASSAPGTQCWRLDMLTITITMTRLR